MNCPKCGGTGFVPTNVFGVNGAIKCDFCDGTGVFITNNEEPQTNDEWRKTCSTEEFAEFLSKIEEQYPCGSFLKCDVTCGYHSQCRNDDVAPTNKEAWVEWLKQPHTEKE